MRGDMLTLSYGQLDAGQIQGTVVTSVKVGTSIVAAGANSITVHQPQCHS